VANAYKAPLPMFLRVRSAAHLEDIAIPQNICAWQLKRSAPGANQKPDALFKEVALIVSTKRKMPDVDLLNRHPALQSMCSKD
jgi:hypothetical protein